VGGGRGGGVRGILELEWEGRKKITYNAIGDNIKCEKGGPGQDSIKKLGGKRRLGWKVKKGNRRRKTN